MIRLPSRTAGLLAIMMSTLSCARGAMTVGSTPAAGARSGAEQQPTRQYPGFELVWADEFTGTGAPDPKNWTFERGFVRNLESQWYRPDNARQADGFLIIEARRERVVNPRFHRASSDWTRNRQFAEYTSASLTTRGLRSWQYGRFEMRGRIDTRAGLWPAFWTLGVKRPWPHNGEIDILEYTAGCCSRMWRGAVRNDSSPFGPTRAGRSTPSISQRGRARFTSGAWIGTSAPSSCQSMASG